MTDAFVYDAIRTPRGKGKPDGSLYEVKPVQLLAGLLTQLQARHNLDTAQVDDVVMGVVSPVGDQGAVIAKVAALRAGWDVRCAGVQINRFCASGLEAVNLAAQKVRSGWEDLVVAGGVESMSRVPLGSDGGAWALDPDTNSATGFVPQGVGADLIATLSGFTRHDVDAYALSSQKRAAHARASGYFAPAIMPVTDAMGQTLLAQDEFIKPGTTLAGLAALRPSFESMGRMGFDDVALSRYPQLERIHHVHHAGNSSGMVDGAAAVLVGSALEPVCDLYGVTQVVFRVGWQGAKRRRAIARQGFATPQAPRKTPCPSGWVDIGRLTHQTPCMGISPCGVVLAGHSSR